MHKQNYHRSSYLENFSSSTKICRSRQDNPVPAVTIRMRVLLTRIPIFPFLRVSSQGDLVAEIPRVLHMPYFFQSSVISITSQSVDNFGTAVQPT